ncbi:MAG: class I tRNA ligase family protein, partial [Candidatus Aenigmatarchaeota archaeon]
VHIAPGHGPEDFEAGQERDIPIFCPVDDGGKYKDSAGKYAGMDVFDANKRIIEDLEEEGYMVFWNTITHSYPHCWRCDSPLIYVANRQWFIEVDDIKEMMISENKKVNWKPNYVGEKRFGDW